MHCMASGSSIPWQAALAALCRGGSGICGIANDWVTAGSVLGSSGSGPLGLCSPVVLVLGVLVLAECTVWPT